MQSEEEVLGFWAKNKIFEKSVRQRKGAKRFVFFEGPPYANGLPGIHHIEARAFKDVVVRYKTMRGFLVERRAGWDTHGLPTEMAAEKKLGITRKRDIEEKIGIRKFVETARADVFFYKAEWERTTERMGYWLDFKNAYVTMTNGYMESLWWIMKELWNKKLFYEDKKILPWCTRCGTALSSHELAQGYMSVTENSVYARFHLHTRRASLLVWTTTPWTLPANVAVAVHPDLTYVTIDDKGDKLILLKSRAAVLFPGREILFEEKGSNLEGLVYEPLFPSDGMPYRVVLGDFISAADGTGIVHIAPAFGEDDMKVAKREELPVLMTIDDEGKFTDTVPQWKGMFVKDTDPLIIKDLEQKGFLWRMEPFTHEYPFCWRCDSPLIYIARRSWWVRVSAFRKHLIESNKKINWHPAYLQEGRFGQWLKDAKDWAFSRERYWGTPIPVWRCAACNHTQIFGSLAELQDRTAVSGNTYYIVRHGFSKQNQADIYSTDPTDTAYGLTARGVAEIKKVARMLKKEKIELIISSDILRARQTTEILAKALGVPVLYDHDIRELNIAGFEGRPATEAHVWEASVDRFTTPFPGSGGESWNDLKKRIFRFYTRTEELHKKKRIGIVSHGDSLWFLEAIIRGTLEAGEKPRARYLKTGECRRVITVGVPRNDYGELDLHRPYIDELRVICPECTKDMTRIQDVADVWFDSGAMPFASWHYPFEHKERIDKKLSYPADYIAEAIDQTRGWFYLLLVVATLLGREAPYKNVISLGHVLDKTGKKMSKSRGNVVSPGDLFNTYGADAVRWYFYTVNQPEDSKLFEIGDVEKAKRNFLDLFFNTVNFFQLYRDVRPRKQKTAPHILDTWLNAKLASVRDHMTQKMDAYDIVGAARILEDFVANDISRWYVRRSRERLKIGHGLGTFKAVLLEVVVLAAPFTPFISEQMYRIVGGKNISVHLESWPKKRSYKKKVLNDMDAVRALAAKGLELRARAGIKVRQPLQSLSVRKISFREKAYYEVLQEELNIKKVLGDKKLSEDVVLDTVITEELKREGVARDLIRSVQELRKKAGLNPKDKIIIALSGITVDPFRQEVLRAVNAARIIKGARVPQPLIEDSIMIDGEKISLSLGRAS